MVAAAGAAVSGGPGRLQRDGVGPRTRRSPRAALCVAASTAAPTACERTALPAEAAPSRHPLPPSAPRRRLPAGTARPRPPAWGVRKGGNEGANKEGLGAPRPDALASRPRRTRRVGPEPPALARLAAAARLLRAGR